MDQELAEDYNLEEYNSALDFKETLMYQNRFFVNHPFMDKVKKYIQLVDTNSSLCPFEVENCKAGEILYRARICDEKIYKKIFPRLKQILYLQNSGEKVIHKPLDLLFLEEKTNGFYGYDEISSFAPHNLDGIPDGRVNPRYIRYLYTSKSEYTALIEVRPVIDSHISIAEIRVSEPLSILKIKSNIMYSDRGVNIFAYQVNKIFSAASYGELKDYLAAQYITEYIKSIDSGNKYDGIQFKSSLDKKGENIVIFNPDKCKAVSSKVYKVTKIAFYADCMAPLADDTELKPE